MPASLNPLQMYSALQIKYDRELIRILELAARDIRAQVLRLQIKTGIGAKVRTAQLTAVLNEIKQIEDDLWNQGVRDLTMAGRKAAAGEAERAAQLLTDVIYADLPEAVAETLQASLRATAQAGIEADYARVPRSLSSRVYHNYTENAAKIEDTIRKGLIQGKSARELAKDVYGFVSPTVPGGQSYAATRLARTEINNAFHEQQIKSANRPGVRGVKWNLSGSHPKPDECNDYAQRNSFNLGQGVFPLNDVPPKPHPHCLCYLTYVSMTPAELSKAFHKGDFDAEMTRREQENLKRLGVKTATKVPTPEPKITMKNKVQEKTVNQTLTRQKRFAPNGVSTLHEVRLMKETEGYGGLVNARYVPESRTIALSQKTFSLDYEVASKARVESGYYSHCGHDFPGAPQTIAHEFGHHLDVLVGAREVEKLDQLLTALDLPAFAPVFEKHGSFDAAARAWRESHADKVVGQVSGYAGVNFQEMIAEVWAEFTMSPTPRAHIKRAGKLLQNWVAAITE